MNVVMNVSSPQGLLLEIIFVSIEIPPTYPHLTSVNLQSYGLDLFDTLMWEVHPLSGDVIC